MEQLLKDIRNCKVCTPHLELGPNPVLSASSESKIAIIGQAPGAVVHKSGIPWEDKSGDNLRQWMQVSRDTFYNTGAVALIPMGFCYPGKGKSGDLPPRKECAPLWHHLLWEQMKQVKLTLLIGAYAQKYYLQDRRKKTLTETVKNFEEYLPRYFVLPHPSPRNNIWRAKNPWFDEQVIPRLRKTIKQCL